jgi:hypothetical protein
MSSALIYLKDAALTLTLVGPPAGSPATYQGDVKTAEVVPTAGDSVKTTTLDGTVHERQGAPSYALHLVSLQDYGANGLGRFLWDNARKDCTFTLQAYGATTPPSATAPAITGVVVLAEGNYGGEVDTWPQMDVTLLCTARPTLKVA